MNDMLYIFPTPVQPTGTAGTRTPQRSPATGGGTSFDEVFRSRLAQQQEGVSFSRHAAMRLEERGIRLTDDSLTRINRAVALAAGKGARDSLVFLDDTAFVVSITNKTVVTVVDRENVKNNVFTNIDSAVIA